MSDPGPVGWTEIVVDPKNPRRIVAVTHWGTEMPPENKAESEAWTALRKKRAEMARVR